MGLICVLLAIGLYHIVVNWGKKGSAKMKARHDNFDKNRDEMNDFKQNMKSDQDRPLKY